MAAEAMAAEAARPRPDDPPMLASPPAVPRAAPGRASLVAWAAAEEAPATPAAPPTPAAPTTAPRSLNIFRRLGLWGRK